jgi:sulfide dehydrogenase cytochrome subunit
MTGSIRIAFLLGSGLLLGAAQLSAAPTASMLADACAGCHGTDGSSLGPATPTIAGQSKKYFIDSMKAFKSGARPGPLMGQIAKGYTDEEIELLAGYFAGKPYARANQAVDAVRMAAGEKLYDANCETCHSENGSDADDDTGLLAGQWLPYLQYTMQDFRSGARTMPKKMKSKVEKLDDVQIEALLQFFAGQP